MVSFRHSNAIIAFWQFDIVDTIDTCLALSYYSSGHRMPHYHTSTSHMGFFTGIIGILVYDIYTQNACWYD